MIDGLDLKKEIKKRGLKMGWVASQLGITLGTFSRKIHSNQGLQLNSQDWDKLAILLGIERPPKEPDLTKHVRLVKVEASGLAVHEHWHLVVYEDGQEVADNQWSKMYIKGSDWSTAHQLTQKICEVVFDGENVAG
jgi:hypothetical protein